MRKPKKPKQPRQSASLNVWLAYDKRVTDWKKRVNSIEAGKKKKASIIAKHRR